MILKPTWQQIRNLSGAWRQHPRYWGCIGHWIMAEGGGTRLYDLSRVGNHATFGASAAAPTWSTGKFGPVVRFDGSDDYASAPHNAIQSAAQWTVSAWVLVNNYTDFNVIINKGDATNRNYEIDIAQTTGVLRMVFTQGSGTFRLLSSGTAIPTGIWTHVVCKYDGAFMQMWINGQVANTTAQTGAADTPALSITIGALSASGNFFDGPLDDIRVYNRALSSGETLSLYHRPFLEFEEAEDDIYFVPAAGVGFQAAWAKNANALIGGRIAP